MSKVFVDVGVSVDGYIAGPNRGLHNPLGDRGTGIHQWAFQTASFLERLGLSGGQTSPDDQLIDDVFERAGAYVMGRRMFDEGEKGWPENPPFRAPVFVLTHAARKPRQRQGGTTFYFVTNGIVSALNQAQAAAGGKDIRVQLPHFPSDRPNSELKPAAMLYAVGRPIIYKVAVDLTAHTLRAGLSYYF